MLEWISVKERLPEPGERVLYAIAVCRGRLCNKKRRLGTGWNMDEILPVALDAAPGTAGGGRRWRLRKNCLRR